MQDAAIQAVYKATVPVDLVLVRNGFKSGVRRIPSPGKCKRNLDIAVYADGFTDFSRQVSGDVVMLDYYLKSNGGILEKGKGVDSDYFRWKAEILGVDLNSPNSEKQILPKRVFVPAPETVESIKQSDENISKSFIPLYKYMYKKDRKPIYSHLRGRGMTDEEIKNSPFVCAPKKEDINNILNIVNNYGTDTEGLPGFYEGPNGAFTMRVSSDDSKTNLMIPIFNTKKQLVSFHFRGLTKNSCYWSLSSNGEKKGCSPGTPTGLWGQFNSDTIILTEGALKGYLAHIWTGMTVMYVLGVSSQTMLSEALNDAKKAGVKHVIIAFDMDYKTKEQVKESVEKAKIKVKEAGLSYNTITWNPKYNGIDDYLLYAKRKGVQDKVVNFIKNSPKEH